MKVSPKRRAIFLDRDGVINENRSDHVKSWNEFVFLSRAEDALHRVAASDFLAIVTTNQSAVHRGSLSEITLRDIHARMSNAIANAGGRLDAVFYCPHLPEENCGCRKPRIGMFSQAAEKWAVDFPGSYVIGDAMADVRAAQQIGSTPILVLTGRGSKQHDLLLEGNHSGFHVADDLWDAVEWIWRRENILG
jgi:D-glycero-D-manno-heptose 1,7-bisphosphate phosphatase